MDPTMLPPTRTPPSSGKLAVIGMEESNIETFWPLTNIFPFCRRGDGNGSVDAQAVSGATHVADVNPVVTDAAATDPLLAPSAKTTSAVHPSDNIRPFTMAALNSVTIGSGKSNKRGEEVEATQIEGAWLV